MGPFSKPSASRRGAYAPLISVRCAAALSVSLALAGGAVTASGAPAQQIARVRAPAGAAAGARGRVAPASSSDPSVARAAYTLTVGSRGTRVRALQRALARLTYLPSWAVDGVYGIRTWHAVVAFQGWTDLQRDGVAGPRTLAALAHARPPTPWSSSEGIEVHIPQQVMLLVRGGRVQRAIHVSTGMPGWPTPVGHFRIQARYTLSWSAPFQAWMPLAQYFYDGYAMHEYPEVPAYPASHGCVRISESEAPTVWSFGRVGMRVWTTA